VRGRRFGERLFDHAVLHARNRGIETLIIHALTENTAMMRIVRKPAPTSSATAGGAGAPEAAARGSGVASGTDLREQAAEFDYRLKVGARVRWTA
jgi:ribosomal protein S18 acetylase RimI-like enzyme